jgi:hypothetical protein
MADSTHVFLRQDAVRRPLDPPYSRPHNVLARTKKRCESPWTANLSRCQLTGWNQPRSLQSPTAESWRHLHPGNSRHNLHQTRAHRALLPRWPPGPVAESPFQPGFNYEHTSPQGVDVGTRTHSQFVFRTNNPRPFWWPSPNTSPLAALAFFNFWPITDLLILTNHRFVYSDQLQDNTTTLKTV